MHPAVQEAMARRGMTMGQAPQMDAPQQQAPMQSAPQSPMAQGQPATQKFQPQTQEDIIVMALIEHLESKDKLANEQLKMSAPQPQSSPMM